MENPAPQNEEDGTLSVAIAICESGFQPDTADETDSKTPSTIEDLAAKLPSLEDLPRLSQELERFMTACIMRIKIRTHLDERDNKPAKRPSGSDVRSAIILKDILPKDKLELVNRAISGEIARGFNMFFGTIIVPVWLSLLSSNVREYVFPSLHTRIFRAEVKSVFERLRFCYLLYKNGETHQKIGHTDGQRNGGQELLEEADKYAEQLGIAMVNLETELITLDIMPDLGSDGVAQQLALLPADQSNLDKMMGTTRDIERYQAAYKEVDQ